MATTAIIPSENLDITRVLIGEIRSNKAGGKTVPITLACMPSPPGGYALNGKFYPCPAGTHNPVVLADTAMACIPCLPPYEASMASSAVCSYCANKCQLPQLLDATNTTTTMMMVYTILFVSASSSSSSSSSNDNDIQCAASNGTVFGRWGATRLLIHNSIMDTSSFIETTAQVECMALSWDESTLYWTGGGGGGGDAIMRLTSLGNISPFSVGPNDDVIMMMCTTRHYLFVLSSTGEVWRLLEATASGWTKMMDGVDSIARHESIEDDAIVVLRLHDGLFLLTLAAEPLWQGDIISSTFGGKMVRWPAMPNGTIVFMGHAIVFLRDNHHGSVVVVAGSLEDGGLMDWYLIWLE